MGVRNVEVECPWCCYRTVLMFDQEVQIGQNGVFECVKCRQAVWYMWVGDAMRTLKAVAVKTDEEDGA